MSPRPNPLQSTDLDLEIAAGRVAGKTVVHKFGWTPGIAIDATVEIWDGGAPYVYPTSDVITSLSQTADQVAMRSCVIEVHGVDANWNLVIQNKALDATNTTTPVTLDTPLLRVFRLKVMGNVVGDSDIRAHNAGETQDYAVITAGNNQTLMAVYSVPAGKVAYVTHYQGYAVESVAVGKPDSTEFKLWMADRANGYEFQIKNAVAIPKQGAWAGNFFKPYWKVVEKCDIKMTGTPTGAAVSVHSGFDLILEDNGI